jgi:hypothetical protein
MSASKCAAYLVRQSLYNFNVLLKKLQKLETYEGGVAMMEIPKSQGRVRLTKGICNA